MKIIDKFKCAYGKMEPKKYIGLLKVILMFDSTDPSKLVYQIGKYKMDDEPIESYCYKKIEDVYNLYQEYKTYCSFNYKLTEYICIDGKKTGICQRWMYDGHICDEGYYVNDVEHGEWLCYVDYCGGTDYIGYGIQYYNGVCINSDLQ